MLVGKLKRLKALPHREVIVNFGICKRNNVIQSFSFDHEAMSPLTPRKLGS